MKLEGSTIQNKKLVIDERFIYMLVCTDITLYFISVAILNGKGGCATFSNQHKGNQPYKET